MKLPEQIQSVPGGLHRNLVWQTGKLTLFALIDNGSAGRWIVRLTMNGGALTQRLAEHNDEPRSKVHHHDSVTDALASLGWKPA